jgi:hypothetical protein
VSAPWQETSAATASQHTRLNMDSVLD